MIGQIINIDTKNDRCALAVSNGADNIHQFGLAVITTINVIRAVRSTFHLGSVDGRPTQIPFSC